MTKTELQNQLAVKEVEIKRLEVEAQKYYDLLAYCASCGSGKWTSSNKTSSGYQVDFRSN